MTKVKAIGIFVACIAAINSYTQDLSYSKPGNNFYKEMANPAATPMEEWAKIPKSVNAGFASDNVRYPKERVPFTAEQTKWNATAWRGEKIHTQILVWTKKDIGALRFQLQDLVNEKGDRIPVRNVKAAFVRYVMSDEFDGGCDHQNNVYDSSLVSDPIDIIDRIPVAANTVQPVWLSIQVPAATHPGTYTGSVIVLADGKYPLTISINVLDHLLPPPAQWKYDLDLWQYPDPIAKIHNVKLWSKEHFDLMRPYYTTLANAGQKVITANIIEQPWGLTHVHFDDPTLVKWTKKKDGSWTYDFSLFDRYVSFVMGCGITQRINCYTMITWDLSYIYYDEASGKNVTISLKPGTAEYDNFWMPMLKSFTAHLKDKKWFDITSIAMDERPIESMQAVITLLKKIDPAWKLALAGDEYHSEFGDDIFDYSIASYLKFDPDVLERRKAAAKPTTFYTACVEEHPGPYTFSAPAENTWLAWFAAAKGYTGYLFWAYNTWVKNPLADARWRRYPSGTLFQFYPGPRTSIRFEKLIEGVQDFEKIRIIKEQFAKEGNAEKLKELDKALSSFEIKTLETIPAAEMVEKAKALLNQY
jgi:hypothetical protein